jgi:ERCC4-type nuclease
VLLVDDREHAPLRAQVEEAIPTASVQRLMASDYLLFDADGHSIGIERKEIKDLLNSIARNKVKRQIQSLLQFDRGILLIEGRWDVKRDGSLWVHNRRSGWRPQSIQAILLALQEQTGVKVLHTTNFDETVLVLKMLDKRGEHGCFWEEESDEQPAAA